MMYNGRTATEQAVMNFPHWMDIRKRLRTSVGGKYLRAVLDEQNSLIEAFEEFKKTFFLKYYQGHEDEIPCIVYVAQVGDLDDIHSMNDRYLITGDASLFAEDTKTYSLYRNGFLVLDVSNIDDEKNPVVAYKSNDEVFKAPAEKEQLWNIFDEFALFSGLTRYDGESNYQLEQRILAAFKNPTNSTATGIKNAIINSVINYDHLKKSEIKIEQPDGVNMGLELPDGTSIYDKMSQVNKDIASEKVWNETYWENGFKKMQYIPNVWDYPLEAYQPGTGQRDDLKTILSTDIENEKDEDDKEIIGSTDVEVTGYETNKYLVNEYIRKQGIKKNIPLKLVKFKNSLITKPISYVVHGADAVKVDSSDTYIQSSEHKTGTFDIALGDIIIDKGELTEIKKGLLKANEKYTLIFYPRNDYSEMKIDKCNFVDSRGVSTNLLESRSSSGFGYEHGVFRYTGTKLHTSEVSSFSDVKNVENNTDNYIILGREGTSGSFALDVTGMSGQNIYLDTTCLSDSYTGNPKYVKYSGNFKLSDDESELVDADNDTSSHISINMDCQHLEFEFAEAAENIKQSAIQVSVLIDNEIDIDNTGLYHDAKKFVFDFPVGEMHNVRIDVSKVSTYPVTIKNIMAARYKISYSVNGKDLVRYKIGDNVYKSLPRELPDGSLLKINIEQYSKYAPIIKYIHIGPPLVNVKYEVNDILAGASGGSLDIDSSCRVELYQVSDDGTKSLLDKDYNTKTQYINENSEDTDAVVDLSDFVSVNKTSSQPRLTVRPYHGKNEYFITLSPGQKMDSIEVVGERKVIKEKHSLKDILKLKNSDVIYVAENSNGFVIKQNNGESYITTITKDSFGRYADEYEFIDLPDNLSGVFVMDKINGYSSKTNKRSGYFEECYLTTKDTNSYKYKTYIANCQAEITSSPFDVDFPTNFSPDPENKLIFYKIDPIEFVSGGEAHAYFIKNAANKNDVKYEDWSIGRVDNVRIEYDFKYTNKNNYELEVSNLNESFTISNNIDLKDFYTLDDGTKIVLGQWIIEPPDDMRVTYNIESVAEGSNDADKASYLYVNNDGFNKLYYSNIKDIISLKIISDGEQKVLSANDYSLMENEGIIIWKDKSKYAGKRFSVVYEYRKPTTLEFKDLSYLYKLAGYSIDAYQPINVKPITLNDVKVGTIRTITINGKVPDKITAKCLNENYYASIVGNKLTVNAYPSTTIALIHSGYYYDDDKEYYQFENDRAEEADCFENIETHNTQSVANTIRTIQDSDNFVKDSILINGDHYEETCRIDGVKDNERIRGISKMDSLTACDSYQLWNSFNMEVSLDKGYNGKGLKFASQDSSAYAYIEITPYIDDKDIEISFIADKGITARIMVEVEAHDDSMRKSVFAEELAELTRNDTYLYIHLSDIDKDKRYYLLVTGSGTIDDIILRDYDKDSAIEDTHTKNLDILNFNIEEAAQKDTEVSLKFDTNGNLFDGLEMDMDGLIQTGSSADWGVTLIKSFQGSLSDFSTDNVDIRKEVLYSRDEDGEVTSPWIKVHDSGAVDTLYVKINDMLIDPMRLFTIYLYTASDDKGTDSRVIWTSKKTNLLEMKPTSLGPYVQIVAEMPAGRVINNIEIYARYVENLSPLHVWQNQTGSLTTKLYDTLAVGNYVLKYMKGYVVHPENISILIRGYRREEEHGVWTRWYPAEFDENMKFSSSTHEFDGYRYFQLKIEISDMNASIKIDELIFGVV